MKQGLSTEQAKKSACEYGLILKSFTVSSDHSVVLCELGREYSYSKNTHYKSSMIDPRLRTSLKSRVLR